jgi:AraC family transcriptional activator FtrA
VEVDPDVLYVDNGSVLTSAGKAAALDLCLHLVRLDYGSSIANAVARRLVVPPHRAGGQAQFVTTPVPAQDNHPLTAMFPWVIERLDQPLTVEDLARRARMSWRNLGRHFRAATGTTPLQWLLTQRIRRAQELLETTDDSVDANRGSYRHGHRHDAAPTPQPHCRRAPRHLPPHLPLAIPPRPERPPATPTTLSQGSGISTATGERSDSPSRRRPYPGRLLA